MSGKARRPAQTARSLEDLAAAGVLPRAALAGAEGEALRGVADAYAVAVTPELLSAIDPDDPNDPIARQYLPSPAELEVRPEELADPIGDAAHSPVKGVVHRYPDRVLLKPLHACPVYCRFCFRREMVGPGGEALSSAALERALGYIRGRPEIWEVILTGGDPLILAPRRLGEIVAALDAIPHIGAIRIHSRVPVADTARIDDALIAAIRPRRAALYVGVHCNHARELTQAARAALARLADAGIPLLSQTVLLRGVNDTVEALVDLMRGLVEARVRPYYLHHPDLARGTGHFRVSIAEGQALVRALRGRISGLCQPTYVLDIPGGHGKSPLTPSFVEADGPGWRIADYRGGEHRYDDPDPA